MPRFFVDSIEEEQVCLTGEDAKHLSRVLRVRVGDTVTLCNKQRRECTGIVESVSADAVMLRTEDHRSCEAEPIQTVTLYQALPKGDKLDFIVQKAVELGAAKIVPVLTRYCVVKADRASFEKKRVRLNRIAAEAAKQCGRGILPEVEPLLTFGEAVERMKGEKAMVCYEHGGAPIRSLVSSDDTAVSVFVGSEGGFSEEEIQKLNDAGVPCATLGKLILRCETAPIVALSRIMNEFEIL